GVHVQSAEPNKFQPQPNGSEATCHAYEKFTNTNETVNAIHAASPSGINAYAYSTNMRRRENFWNERLRANVVQTKKMPGTNARFVARKINAYSHHAAVPTAYAASFNTLHGPRSTIEYANAQVSMMSALYASSSRRPCVVSKSLPGARKKIPIWSLAHVFKHSVHMPQYVFLASAAGYTSQGQP